MERGEIGGRLNDACAIRVQQVLRLVFELIEIWTDGRARQHDEPPEVPGVRCLGRRRFAGRRQTLHAFAASARQATTSLAVNLRWTQSFPRTGGALHA